MFFTDLTSHFNTLNTKLQGLGKKYVEGFGTKAAREMLRKVIKDLVKKPACITEHLWFSLFVRKLVEKIEPRCWKPCVRWGVAFNKIGVLNLLEVNLFYDSCCF